MKKMIKKVIFDKIDYDKPILFSTIKDIVQDDDVIHAGWDEGFYTENNSIEGHYFMRITREVLETDTEYDKRMKQAELTTKWAKERRYESYLKLKKEFEQEDASDTLTGKVFKEERDKYLGKELKKYKEPDK